MKEKDRFPFEILFLILAAAMFLVVCLRFSLKIESLDERVQKLEKTEQERIEKQKSDPLEKVDGMK